MPENINTLLGFDYGKKVIGVAVGQTVTLTATPLEIIKVKNNQVNWMLIHSLIKQWQVDALVVGIPKDLPLNKQHITQACVDFPQNLKKHTQIPVFLIDEQYTSVAAYAAAKNSVGKMPKRLDSIAAKIILESWLRHPSKESL